MNSVADKMYGSSPVFSRALNAARMVAGTDVTVLIIGEPGTGKEMMAYQVHASSRRAGGSLCDAGG